MLDALRAAIPTLPSVRGRVSNYTVHDVEPGIVLEPRSAEEAAQILALASENGWRVECAGANTMHNGNRRTRVDIVLSTCQLTNIVEYEPADLVMGVQVGMPLHKLQEEAARNAQFLALDPPANKQSTLGGVIAAARSGPLRCMHGTPRDHVLGLQLVTGDGRILNLGGRVVKNVAGYDLVRLAVGSAGTLGLITQAYVRLKPLPQADATMIVSATERAPLLDLVQQITEQHLEAAALELIRARSFGEDWLLLVRLQGSQEAVNDASARIRAMAQKDGANARTGDGNEWQPLADLELGAASEVRLADLPGRIENTLQQAVRLQEKLAGKCDLAAHATDGIVRLLIAENNAEETAFFIGEARAVLAKTGGTVIVRSRSADLMRRVDAFGANGLPLQLMAQLKQSFDPAGILAPGRFVV